MSMLNYTGIVENAALCSERTVEIPKYRIFAKGQKNLKANST